MIEKVDVRNEKMYISIISVRQMEAYVKSWVSVILGVRWARKQLLVRGDTTPCVDSTQSLCGLHTETGAGGAGAGRGGAGGSRKVWRHGILLPPTHTHTPKIANPRCGWIRGRGRGRWGPRAQKWASGPFFGPGGPGRAREGFHSVPEGRGFHHTEFQADAWPGDLI